ncbi:MAG: hypothetical protein PHY93_09475 [Bacteriovorax sp.]|nr:hypothetical protein [Bacteriovorax sp.]
MKANSQILLKFALSFILLINLTSCSRKNFEKEIILKPVPLTVSWAGNEASLLRDYADKLKKIDIDKTLSQINNKAEKKKFKYRIVDLKIAYNKCVDKLQEIEKVHPKDTSKKVRELKQDMIELNAIWQYIIANYKI